MGLDEAKSQGKGGLRRKGAEISRDGGRAEMMFQNDLRITFIQMCPLLPIFTLLDG